MSLTITPRFFGSILVLDAVGRITQGEGTAVLRDSIRHQLKRRKKMILLNLEKVEYVDCSGIGELVSLFVVVINQGGQLKLLAANKRIDELERKVGELETTPAKLVLDLLTQKGISPPLNYNNTCDFALYLPLNYSLQVAFYQNFSNLNTI